MVNNDINTSRLLFNESTTANLSLISLDSLFYSISVITFHSIVRNIFIQMLNCNCRLYMYMFKANVLCYMVYVCMCYMVTYIFMYVIKYVTKLLKTFHNETP